MTGHDVRSNHLKKLGEAVRRRRESLALSQEQLAELVDCHRNYVGKIERGTQNLTISTLLRFASALKVKTASLMFGLGEESSD